MSGEDDIKVEYTVKELLAGIKQDQTAGFATVNTKLDTKADQKDITQLGERVDHLDVRLGAVEKRLRDDETASRVVTAQRDAWRDWRRWAIGCAVLVVASQPWNWHL